MSAIAVPPHRSAATQDPESAASRLFSEHSEHVFGYCLHQLRSRAEAEDATQTTFLYALRALRRGVVPECEPAWLTTIARNVCHSERRTVDRRGPLAPEVDLDTIALAQAGEDEEELLLGFREALASMPERQRRALVLREWQGVPSREIASELGLSATATHALLTRARHSFAQALTVPARPVARPGVAGVRAQVSAQGASRRGFREGGGHLGRGPRGGAGSRRSRRRAQPGRLDGSVGSGARHRPVGDRVERRPRRPRSAPHPLWATRRARGLAREHPPARRSTPQRPRRREPSHLRGRRLPERPEKTAPAPAADGDGPDPEPTKPAVDIPVALPIDPPQLPVVELPPACRRRRSQCPRCRPPSSRRFRLCRCRAKLHRFRQFRCPSPGCGDRAAAGS